MDVSSWNDGDGGVAMNRAPRQTGPLLSPASLAERAAAARRLWWAIPIALAILILIAWLGPDAETIERKFTPYGDAGPLRIMPEISIEDGSANQYQRAASEATPPPAAPDYQVEPEDLAADAEEPVPPPSDTASEVAGTGESEQDLPESDVTIASDGNATADLDMPTQTVDSDFIITRLVRPLYPAQASAADRARPVITVTAAFFLDSDGNVTALIIQSNDGGPEFAEAARKAMEEWEFAPRRRDGEPPAPRWLVVTWRFRSPFSGPRG